MPRDILRAPALFVESESLISFFPSSSCLFLPSFFFLLPCSFLSSHLPGLSFRRSPVSPSCFPLLPPALIYAESSKHPPTAPRYSSPSCSLILLSISLSSASCLSQSLVASISFPLLKLFPATSLFLSLPPCSCRLYCILCYSICLLIFLLRICWASCVGFPKMAPSDAPEDTKSGSKTPVYMPDSTDSRADMHRGVTAQEPVVSDSYSTVTRWMLRLIASPVAVHHH